MTRNSSPAFSSESNWAKNSSSVSTCAGKLPFALSCVSMKYFMNVSPFRIEKGAAGSRAACRAATPSGCLGQLGSQHFEPFDNRRHGEQGGSLRHQGLADRSVQMVLAAGFIAKRVEDTERGRADTQSEPHWRGLLL